MGVEPQFLRQCVPRKSLPNYYLKNLITCGKKQHCIQHRLQLFPRLTPHFITVTIIVQPFSPLILPPIIQTHHLFKPLIIQTDHLFKPPIIQSHRLFNSPIIQNHILFRSQIIQTCRHQLFKVAAHTKKGQSSAETQIALQAGTNYSNLPAPIIQKHVLFT